MELIGYLGALVIGLTLGLLGGGGSILAVPLFVYVLGISPITATAYSLFVVGATSLIGTISKSQQNLVDFRTGIVFGIPALITVYLTRKFIIPSIPETLFTVSEFPITRDLFIMLLFSILMLAASISMIRGRNEKGSNESPSEKKTFNYPLIILEGVIVGILTGLVGAGGGFLIIPALVLFAKLPMKIAVGTSLFIVTLKSLIGFIGDVENLVIEWNFLLIFTGISILGILIGVYASRFISNAVLKKSFGWFVLLMAIFILFKEIYDF